MFLAASTLVVSIPAVASQAAMPASGATIDSHVRGTEGEGAGVAPFEVRPSSLAAGTYSQDVDHFGAASGQKFNQRYWVESSYANASSPTTAPVILHICGEGDATQGYFLNDNAIAWAKSLGAHIVYLEHRYYGQSLPFSDLSSAHMKYLTLDNVMEDLAGFQKWLSASKGWTGKWLSVGGSYSGTLSALYRQRHPELVVGALASSAPMISGVGSPVNSGGSSVSSTTPNADRPWAYQACTTFGFWEADGASFNSELLLPSASLCRGAFGSTVTLVDTTAYNRAYDQPFLSSASGSPSNILFTYGSEDVWTQIGLIEQTNQNPNIVISMIQGAGHHYDLNAPTSSDSKAVIAARTQFLTLAKQWLK